MSVSGAKNKNSSLASSSLMGMVSSLKVKHYWRIMRTIILRPEHRDRGEDQHQRGGHGQLGLQVPGRVLSLEKLERIDIGEICRLYDYHSPSHNPPSGSEFAPHILAAKSHSHQCLAPNVQIYSALLYSLTPAKIESINI